MSTLASRVKEVIEDAKARDISVRDIAKACGVTVQSVYQWMQEGERVDIDGSKLVELAHVTGYEARWIMNNKGARKKIIPLSSAQEQVVSTMQTLDEREQLSLARIASSMKEPAIYPSPAVTTMPPAIMGMEAANQSLTKIYKVWFQASLKLHFALILFGYLDVLSAYGSV